VEDWTMPVLLGLCQTSMRSDMAKDDDVLLIDGFHKLPYH
jgi:hypothetical protein